MVKTRKKITLAGNFWKGSGLEGSFLRKTTDAGLKSKDPDETDMKMSVKSGSGFTRVLFFGTKLMKQPVQSSLSQNGNILTNRQQNGEKLHENVKSDRDGFRSTDHNNSSLPL